MHAPTQKMRKAGEREQFALRIRLTQESNSSILHNFFGRYKVVDIVLTRAGNSTEILPLG